MHIGGPRGDELIKPVCDIWIIYFIYVAMNSVIVGSANGLAPVHDEWQAFICVDLFVNK